MAKLDVTHKRALCLNLTQVAFVIATGEVCWWLEFGFVTDDEDETKDNEKPCRIVVKAKINPIYSIIATCRLEEKDTGGDWVRGSISLVVANLIELVQPDAPVPPAQEFTWRKDLKHYLEVEKVKMVNLA